MITMIFLYILCIMKELLIIGAIICIVYLNLSHCGEKEIRGYKLLLLTVIIASLSLFYMKYVHKLEGMMLGNIGCDPNSSPPALCPGGFPCPESGLCINVPYGVNLGGLFVLEDWFYSTPGVNGTTRVDTDPNKQTGIVKNITDTMANNIINSDNVFFSGECALVSILKNNGAKNEQIYNIFKNHRKTYLGKIPDLLQEIKETKIRAIRLPVTWCIVYDDPYEIKGTDGRKVEINKENMIIKDPYFTDEEQKFWVGIPIKDIQTILHTAGSLGLQVLIDFHTYPGGSSYGSYSGTWPDDTKFWNDNRVARENIRTIVDNFCKWVQNDRDALALKGLYGITPMNEPAHLAGIDSFYKHYPDRWRDKNTRFNEITSVLSESIDVFRSSGMNNHKKKLIMNVIETSTIDFGEQMFTVWRDWWKNSTTSEERKTWAGLDIHHYEAWSNPNSCDSENNSAKECMDHVKDTDWDKVFGDLRDKVVSKDDLFYVTEFSNSLYNDTKYSLASGLANNENYIKIRNKFYEKQIHALHSNNTRGFFWTWDVPLNSNYQSEWSLKNVISSIRDKMTKDD